MFMVSNLKDKKCSRIGLGISKALLSLLMESCPGLQGCRTNYNCFCSSIPGKPNNIKLSYNIVVMLPNLNKIDYIVM